VTEYNAVGTPRRSETTSGANPVTEMKNALLMGPEPGGVRGTGGYGCMVRVSVAGMVLVPPSAELRVPAGIMFW